jgi:hypothetical protein
LAGAEGDAAAACNEVVAGEAAELDASAAADEEEVEGLGFRV